MGGYAMKKIAILLLVLVASLVFGRAQDEDTSKESAYSTYREQTGNVTFMVDSFIAFYSTGQEYMPLHVGLGVFKGDTLKMTLESWSLIDSVGNRSLPVPLKVIQTKYKRLQQDKNLLMQRPMNTGEEFSVLEQVSAAFYPVTQSPRMATGGVELPAGTWWQDTIYFEVPDEGLDGVLSMELDAQGLDKPITVAFRIPHKKEHHKKHADNHQDEGKNKN
jgi:hypothetical protein